MIVSHRRRFVFFHNPKVGGASMHKALERFNDIGFGLHGLDPEGRRWLSHLGVDEFASLYPDLWSRAHGYRLFALWRPPYDRFVSGVFQYSKSHTDTEIRFLPAARRRDFVLALIERLDRLGAAEAVMDRVEDTFFRPQWIYLRSGDGKVRVEAYPLVESGRLLSDLSEHVGEDVTAERINERDQMAPPAVVSALLSSGRIARLARRIPGAAFAKGLLARRYAEARDGSPFGLSSEEEAELRRFVDRFYARDLALLPGASAAA